MRKTENIVGVRYLKQSGEFVITTRNCTTGKTSTTYANTLTDVERDWVKNSKQCFDDAMSFCWTN